MVFAHGSGVDDVLMFVVPVAVAIVALRLAERRARAKRNIDEPSPSHPDEQVTP